MNKFKALIIESGHGLNNYDQNDNWAISDWLVERDLNIVIAEKLSDLLYDNDELPVYDIWIDERLSLNTKIWRINQLCKVNKLNSNNSILLSIHINSWWWEGIETFTFNDYKEWLLFWNKILLNLSETTWMKIRWAKYEKESQYSQLAIIHNTDPLAILVECWFIDNVNDRKILSGDIDLIVNWLYNWLAEICWFDKISKKISYKEMFENEKNRADWLEYKIIWLQNRMSKIKLFANMN